MNSTSENWQLWECRWDEDYFRRWVSPKTLPLHYIRWFSSWVSKKVFQNWPLCIIIEYLYNKIGVCFVWIWSNCGFPNSLLVLPKNLQQGNVHVHHLVVFRSLEQELLNFKWLSSLEINLARLYKKFELSSLQLVLWWITLHEVGYT